MMRASIPLTVVLFAAAVAHQWRPAVSNPKDKRVGCTFSRHGRCACGQCHVAWLGSHYCAAALTVG